MRRVFERVPSRVWGSQNSLHAGPTGRAAVWPCQTAGGAGGFFGPSPLHCRGVDGPGVAAERAAAGCARRHSQPSPIPGAERFGFGKSLEADVAWPEPGADRFWEQPARISGAKQRKPAKHKRKPALPGGAVLDVVHITAEMAPIAKAGDGVFGGVGEWN